MADNVQLNSGSGGAIAASDDIGGVQYQRVKLTLGADGVNDGDVSSTNYLPTSISGVDAHFVTTTTPLAGTATWTSDSMAVTGEGNGLIFFCITDQAGTAYLEESIDNSNWTVTAYSPVVANTPLAEQHVAHAPYFRIRYVNGATPQGSFKASLGHIPFANPWMIKVDPSMNYVQQAGTWVVDGPYSEDTSAPGNDGFWSLTAIASANWPSQSEGNLVSLSTDLEGNLRVVVDRRTAPTITRVSYSSTNTTIVAANSLRSSTVIHNDADTHLYIKFGATATSSSYTYKIAPGAHWEMPSAFFYTGQIDGIWVAGGSGAAQVTDMSHN